MDGERTEGSEVRPEEAGDEAKDEAKAGGHGGLGGRTWDRTPPVYTVGLQAARGWRRCGSAGFQGPVGRAGVAARMRPVSKAPPFGKLRERIFGRLRAGLRGCGDNGMCPLWRADVSSFLPDVSSFRPDVSTLRPNVSTLAGQVSLEEGEGAEGRGVRRTLRKARRLPSAGSQRTGSGRRAGWGH